MFRLDKLAKPRVGVLPAVVASVSMALPSGWAAEAQNGRVLEEVVVVAQKRAQNLQSVPISVTTLTSDALEGYGVTNPLDLQFVTPGLQTTQIVQGFSPRIRGIGSTDVTPGNEGAVSVYVDGVYIPGTANGIISLSNIERIEVLKGPQGTLFGRNTTGGLINVVTKTPSHETGGNISISYDSFDTKIVSGYATTGLGDMLAVDIAGRWEDQGDGWGTNLFNGDEAYQLKNNRVLRSRVLVEPGPDTTITLAGDYSEYDNRYAAWRPEIPSGYYDYEQDAKPYGDGKIWGASVHLEHDFQVADLVLISAYRDLEQASDLDVDLGPTFFQHGLFDSYAKSFSQEIQLLSPDSSKIEWIVGLYYFDRESAFDPAAQAGNLLKLAFSPPLDLYEAYNKQDTKSYAAFAQVTYQVFQDTNLTLGVRYTDDSQDYTGYTKVYPTSGNPAVVVSPGIKDDLEADKSTYRAVLDYQFTEDVMAYLSYNTGFKSGFFNIGGFPADSVGPEFLTAYEAGIKSELFANRLRLNAAMYYYEYDDVQSLFLLGGTAFAVNAGSAEVRGIEMDAQAVPADNWNVNVGVNWMPHAEYDKYTPCPGPETPPIVYPPGSATYDCSGSRMVNTPDWDVTLGTDYTITTSAGDLNFSVLYNYLSDFRWDADFGVIPGYSTGVYKESSHSFVNLRASWTSVSDVLSAALWVKNATDTEYLVYGNQSSGFGKVGLPGAPRIYGGTLEYKF